MSFETHDRLLLDSFMKFPSLPSDYRAGRKSPPVTSRFGDNIKFNKMTFDRGNTEGVEKIYDEISDDSVVTGDFAMFHSPLAVLSCQPHSPISLSRVLPGMHEINILPSSTSWLGQGQIGTLIATLSLGTLRRARLGVYGNEMGGECRGVVVDCRMTINRMPRVSQLHRPCSIIIR